MNKSFYIVVPFFLALCFSYTADAFEVTSPAFEDGGKLPQIYACTRQGGENYSWELNIRDVPAGTVTLVVIMDDPDAKSVAGHTWVHWNVSNIAGDTQTIPSVKSGKKIGKSGYNSNRVKGYWGMCPPNGEHKYILAVYALKVEFKKTLSEMTRKKFEKKYKDEIIGKAEISGRWG